MGQGFQSTSSAYREEVRTYIIGMVSELAGLADSIPDKEMSAALRRAIRLKRPTFPVGGPGRTPQPDKRH